MSKMGEELDRRLEENKYEMYELLSQIKAKLEACFSHNPDIDSAETHVHYLYGVLESCRRDTKKLLAKIEGGV